MKSAILELHDEGLARFFSFEDFGEDYSRTPTDAEYLTRDELERAIASGSEEHGERLSAPALGIRATERGRERVFELWPEERARWESFPTRREGA